MSAATKAKLREAQAARRLNSGTATHTQTNPIDTLRLAARGNWSDKEIADALKQARREVVILEGLQSLSQQGTERTMTAGGFRQE